MPNPRREPIAPPGAATLAPYSPAVAVGELVFVSGQVSVDESGATVADDFESQARRVFAGMGRVLAAAGCGFEDVVSVTSYITDRGDFADFNRIYQEHFSQPYPARVTVVSELLGEGLKLESSAIAVRPG